MSLPRLKNFGHQRKIICKYFVLQAEFVPVSDPSLTQQYEYANEHDIKCLVIITDAGISQTGVVKVNKRSILTY